jgi:hypothetical protein
MEEVTTSTSGMPPLCGGMLPPGRRWDLSLPGGRVASRVLPRSSTRNRGLFNYCTLLQCWNWGLFIHTTLSAVLDKQLFIHSTVLHC